MLRAGDVQLSAPSGPQTGETRQTPCSPPRAALILASFILGLISQAAPPHSLLGRSHHSHFIDGETEVPRGKWFRAAACESVVEPRPRGAGTGLSSWTCLLGWILVSILLARREPLFQLPRHFLSPPIWRAAEWGRKGGACEAWRKERN